jgi:hypothetical protein
VRGDLLGPAAELGLECLGDAGDLVARLGRVLTFARFPIGTERADPEVREDSMVKL